MYVLIQKQMLFRMNTFNKERLAREGFIEIIKMRPFYTEEVKSNEILILA